MTPEPKIKIRIEAVISTAGNNEAYTGYHLGHTIIGRPFTKMVVTFEEEVTIDELQKLRICQDEQSRIVQQFRFGTNAIQIYSFRFAFLSAVSGGWNYERLEENSRS